ncbi:MAG: NAD(P)H-dependent oxidoreductase subunit E [Candidatus Saccharicenans sp.]|nr:MAG: NAD(P)H-dependent oxidoreductase subunit E [Candidatus Aminicenantes bacterium]
MIANQTINLDSVQEIVDRYGGNKSKLIAILQDIQAVYHYLPAEALKKVSQLLKIPLIDIISVATFYRAFSLKPRGKHVATVCLGTACHVRGGPKILEEFERQLQIKKGETSEDGEWSLESVACLGCCAIGPVVVVDGNYYAHTTIRKVPTILEKYRK